MHESVKIHLPVIQARGYPYLIANDILFRNLDGVVAPVGPVKFDYTIPPQDARKVLRQLNGRLLRYTDGFGSNRSPEWYAVIADKFHHLDTLKAKKRKEIRRGLKHCQVRQIDADYVARHGYDTYFQAFSNYRNVTSNIMSEREFTEFMLSYAPFEQAVHFWGVFHQANLIAFAINNIYPPIEVNFWMGKFHPQYLKLFPSYALFYVTLEYYLENLGYDYVNDGWRSLSHDTHIQEYLIRKFQFKKAYSNLSVVYSPVISTAVKVIYPLRRFLAPRNRQIQTLCNLENIRRTCRTYQKQRCAQNACAE